MEDRMLNDRTENNNNRGIYAQQYIGVNTWGQS